MSKKRISSVRPPPAVRPPPTDGRPKNRLLTALPDEEFRRILPDLKGVPLTAKQVLLKRGDPIRHIFFPNGGMCSVMSVDRIFLNLTIPLGGDGARDRQAIRPEARRPERRNRPAQHTSIDPLLNAGRGAIPVERPRNHAALMEQHGMV
jgi:hypothetical protein